MGDLFVINLKIYISFNSRFISIDSIAPHMDVNQALREVQTNIGSGNREAACTQIVQIVLDNSEDPVILLTCTSLLKTIGEREKTDWTVDVLMKCLSTDQTSRLEIAKGLNGLGRFADAKKILSELDGNDNVYREIMRTSYGLGDYSEAATAYKRMNTPNTDDRTMMVDTLCSLRDFKAADDKSSEMLLRTPDDYSIQRCRCSMLLRAGRNKEAEGFVREILKKDKKSADANALAAYFMWMNGKISAAGGYATKAVKTDPKHIGAMETLALCLIEKGKMNEARIVAGAINEQSPGHQSVTRILEMCSQ